MNVARQAISLIFVLLCNVESACAESPASAPQRSIVSQSVQSRPIHCNVFGDGPDVLLVIATIHGNESAGTPLVAAFSEWLQAHPEELEGHKVVIVPVANPDGMASDKRFNSRGVDLNRNFPAGNWSGTEAKRHGSIPLSEPESRALMVVLCQHFPDRVISIHQPLECVDYDGPAADLAVAMAAKCPLEVKRLGGLPGSLGSFVGQTLQKPIITLELPKDTSHDQDEIWSQYGEALVAALRFQRTEPSK